MKRALVLGLARSGEAAALALRATGVEVVAHDVKRECDADLLGRLRLAGVEVHLGEDHKRVRTGL